MKHFSCFLFLLLLLIRTAQAQLVGVGTVGSNAAPGGPPPVQIAPPNHYTHVIDSVSQHLSKSSLSSGIFYDRVMPLAGLHAFNSSGLDTSSARHFRQAYLELYTASYSPLNRLRPAALRTRIDYLTRRDSVPLAVFDAAFHLLDTLAVADNLLPTTIPFVR